MMLQAGLYILSSPIEFGFRVVEMLNTIIRGTDSNLMAIHNIRAQNLHLMLRLVHRAFKIAPLVHSSVARESDAKIRSFIVNCRSGAILTIANSLYAVQSAELHV